MKTYEFWLPKPFSLNNAFSNRKGGGRVKTQRYRDWIKQSGLNMNLQGPRRSLEGPCDVWIRVSPTALAAKQDLDNVVKPILDLLVEHKIIPDDGWRFVRRITVKCCDHIEKPVVVTVQSKG